MPEYLSSLVSDLFYGGMLLTDESLRSRSDRVATASPCRWANTAGGEVSHEKRGYSNPSEVAEVISQALRALEAGYRLVYVTTPYNMQKKALSVALGEHGDASLTAAMEEGRLQVLSVDSCQGSEADCVILSLVRSGAVNAFLEDRRRVCVALSRSKRECVIVGNANNFRKNGSEMWRKIVFHFTAIEDRG